MEGFRNAVKDLVRDFGPIIVFLFFCAAMVTILVVAYRINEKVNHRQNHNPASGMHHGK